MKKLKNYVLSAYILLCSTLYSTTVSVDAAGLQNALGILSTQVSRLGIDDRFGLNLVINLGNQIHAEESSVYDFLCREQFNQIEDLPKGLISCLEKKTLLITNKLESIASDGTSAKLLRILLQFFPGASYETVNDRLSLLLEVLNDKSKLAKGKAYKYLNRRNSQYTLLRLVLDVAKTDETQLSGLLNNMERVMKLPDLFRYELHRFSESIQGRNTEYLNFHYEPFLALSNEFDRLMYETLVIPNLELVVYIGMHGNLVKISVDKEQFLDLLNHDFLVLHKKGLSQSIGELSRSQKTILSRIFNNSDLDKCHVVPVHTGVIPYDSDSISQFQYNCISSTVLYQVSDTNNKMAVFVNAKKKEDCLITYETRDYIEPDSQLILSDLPNIKVNALTFGKRIHVLFDDAQVHVANNQVRTLNSALQDQITDLIDRLDQIEDYASEFEGLRQTISEIFRVQSHNVRLI